MSDTSLYLTLALAGLGGLAILSVAVLTGWRGWLQLKQQELDRRGHGQEAGVPNATQRIEIADLKERIRKLEAIAAGVDL